MRHLKNFAQIFVRLAPNQSALTIVPKRGANFQKVQALMATAAFGITMYYGSHHFSMDGFYEKTIKADFADGEKRAVQVGPKEEDAVLVVKLEGKYYCVSDKCPHFGFSLAKGPLFDDKVVCPLHMASFSVITGANEYGPVFDGLEKFDIKEVNGELHIKVPKDKLNKARTLPMVKQGNDKRRFVIVGGGPAGLSAAETLRQSGFEGEITILSKETVLPYDKTILSKNVPGVEISKISFRDKAFFDTYGIQFKGGSEVTAVDFKKNFVTTKEGSHIHYDQLLIASGGRARVPSVQGVGLQNVFTLREWSDVVKLRENIGKAKKLVVVGASFIGLESAASIKQVYKDLDVTVCDVSTTPYEKVLGKVVGKGVQKLHEENGVKFKFQTSLTSLEGENGAVKRVKLSNGEVLEADFVILGTGITPNTGFAQGIRKDQQGAIETDIYHKTSQPNVHAVGDVASYPYFYTGQQVRVEHYNEAIYQGYIAALNMLGKKVVNDNIPFFWTRFWNKSLQYTGYATIFDDVHVQGDLGKQNFLAWYFLNNRVVAAAAMGQIPHVMIINEAMKHGVLPLAEEIKSGRVTIEDIQKRVQGKGKACRCQREKNCSGHK